MMGRMPEVPLGEGERIVLYQQGAYLPRRSWKLGHLYLTNKRLLFRQVKRLILDIPLENITSVGFRKRPFILATKTCMLLSYRDEASGHSREAIIITAHLHSWCERMAELLSEKGVELKVNGVLTESDIAQARRDRVKEILAEARGKFSERIEEKHIAEVAQALDPASREVIWYLWENRHAKIEELRQLLSESCHMNVLTRIKGVINPTARRMLGVPLLAFEKSRMDYMTGERVLYSWWLSEKVERRPAEVDVFDEGDHVTVIMELAGVQEEDIRVQVEGGKLIVEADAPGHRYYEEITLPIESDTQRFTKSYHNHILQVRFEKAQA